MNQSLELRIEKSTRIIAGVFVVHDWKALHRNDARARRRVTCPRELAEITNSGEIEPQTCVDLAIGPRLTRKHPEHRRFAGCHSGATRLIETNLLRGNERNGLP
jgi:hypothetical protein